jgi:hypothetical protein
MLRVWGYILRSVAGIRVHSLPRARPTSLAGMLSDPLLDLSSLPNPARGQDNFGFRETRLGGDLVDSLTRDAKHPSDLCHADEVMRHAEKYSLTQV